MDGKTIEIVDVFVSEMEIVLRTRNGYDISTTCFLYCDELRIFIASCPLRPPVTFHVRPSPSFLVVRPLVTLQRRRPVFTSRLQRNGSAYSFRAREWTVSCTRRAFRDYCSTRIVRARLGKRRAVTTVLQNCATHVCVKNVHAVTKVRSCVRASMCGCRKRVREWEEERGEPCIVKADKNVRGGRARYPYIKQLLKSDKINFARTRRIKLFTVVLIYIYIYFIVYIIFTSSIYIYIYIYI